MKRKLFGLFLAFCALPFMELRAQEFLPFVSSPYAGVTAGKMNPASLAGSKYKFDVTLFGASAGAHNSLMIFPRKDILFNPTFYKDLWGDRKDFFNATIPQSSHPYLKEYLRDMGAEWGDNPYGGYFGGQIDVLNLMYSFNDRFSMAAGYSYRAMASVNNAYLPVKDDYQGGIPGRGNKNAFTNISSDEATTVAASLFNQVSLSAAYSIIDNGTSRLKLGVTGKLLFGGASAFAYSDSYKITALGAGNGITTINGGEAGIARDGKMGFGVDAGIEYEYRPAELSGNAIADYRLKIGASILDLGNKKSDGANRRDLAGGPNGFPPFGVESYLNAYGKGANKGDYSMGLPTVFTASVDYHFGASPFFLNFTPIIALNQTKSMSSYKFNSYNLVPHAEWKNFGVSVPVQYDQYNKFTAGLGLRAWRHFWIGSNTILKNLWPGDNRNFSADIHVMAKIPILKSTDGDRDGDGVPDKIDKCPDTPGLKKFNGCPDTDGDGIPDDQDLCPNDAGPASTQGCPDRDGDGVIDREDRCPDQPGTKELKGCPDTDGDGIADIDDACPTEAGPACTKGCPDKDGDCVADKDDRCPDASGPAALQGCPDRDGDGIADIDDACPDTPGLKEYNGCPKPEGYKNVEFDVDKFNIKPQFYPELDRVVADMAKDPNVTVKIVGHTDNTYTRAYNMALSKKRAESVKNYLVKKQVNAKRITTEYHGPDKPLDNNNTADGRQKNRRAEITIVIK